MRKLFAILSLSILPACAGLLSNGVPLASSSQERVAATLQVAAVPSARSGRTSPGVVFVQPF